jgi:GNAT superfamily N-acetyltransferase
LTSLVVRADHRRRGAARAVVAAIESIAREAGCFRLEVTTQVHREDAVGFYESIGFAERRYRLVKALE